MAIFKPSNLSPNMVEVDVTSGFDIKFEVHTAGANVSAYELKIYKEFNVEDDVDGEKSIVYSTSGNFTNPTDPTQNITYTNGDEAFISVPPNDITGLRNEENYRWSVRVYQDIITTDSEGTPTDPSFGDYVDNLNQLSTNMIVPTYVGESMIAGSTRDVIWTSQQNSNMKINNYIECRFNSLNSDFNVFEKQSDQLRPMYVTYSSTDVSEIENIYGNGQKITCLKITTDSSGKPIIDKKKFEQLTNKQYYLLLSNSSDFSNTTTVQIQDIVKDNDGNFWFVPYNQSYVYSQGSNPIIKDDRYSSMCQDEILSHNSCYTIECRQRSKINDLYKNVGEQNLTELLMETPFEYSYKNVTGTSQGGSIYFSQGLQSEIIEDPKETKDSNVILKTIYINANLRGSNVLNPTTSGTSISGGWILSGTEDASYGTIHSLYPANCFIKIGNFLTVESYPTANDYKGQIIYKTGSSSGDNTFYISVPTDSSGSSYNWVPYGSCTYNQIVGTSQHKPGFFNAQAYNLQDGQMIIKVPEDFYVNTDQFYALYYVSNPIVSSTSASECAYFLDSGVIGGGEYGGGIRQAVSPLDINGYSIAPTDSSGNYYYYDLFLSPNNGIKPDKNRPIYMEIQNDYDTVKGLVINSGVFDKDLSVDKMDQTQYLCQFLTTVSSGSDDVVKYGIFEPQTKVKIYTQFVDSVPQQYFYAREQLEYYITVKDIFGNGSAEGEPNTINKRDVKLQGVRTSANSTSNLIKYYRYRIYDSSDNELLYDSGNIYNNSMEYVVRGLPNEIGVRINLIYEDNLGHVVEKKQNFQVSYPDRQESNSISLVKDCSLHSNRIGLSGSQGELFPTVWEKSKMDTLNKAINIEEGGEVSYQKVNDETDIEIYKNSTVFVRMTFGSDIVNPLLTTQSDMGDEQIPIFNITVDSQTSYDLSIDNRKIIEESSIFYINEDYRKLKFGYLTESTSGEEIITFDSSDMSELSGFVYMVSETSDSSYSTKIPMITTDTTGVSGIEYPSSYVSAGEFLIPSDGYIIDPNDAFQETSLPQNQYNVLVTMQSNDFSIQKKEG